jgi:hypothetical protein
MNQSNNTGTKEWDFFLSEVVIHGPWLSLLSRVVCQKQALSNRRKNSIFNTGKFFMLLQPVCAILFLPVFVLGQEQKNRENNLSCFSEFIFL